MDFTSRMVALLGELRRERNGAVADAMSPFGKPYGLNYGVSLPTLRQIARAERPDHDFARYLYVQDVRELRLAALYVAQAERVTADEAEFWAAGIVNSEVAEEASFALLSRASPLLQYAALLAAARSPQASLAWVDAALEAVHRNAVEADALAAAARSDAAEDTFAADGSATSAAGNAATAVFAARAAHLVAQGAVALCVAVGSRNEENRLAVHRKAGSLGKLPAEDCVHEELAWRLEP